MTNDPFQLTRLAEELESREQSNPSTSTTSHALPIPAPLSHSNPHLSLPASTFSTEAFLLSRLPSSLPDLRAELREYLGELKAELVGLINADYEAFISLSTDLREEGGRLERLGRPLGGLRERVLVSAVYWREKGGADGDYRNRGVIWRWFRLLFRVNWRRGQFWERKRCVVV
jgi:conserved oligomeric Golgi complex subunit 2